MCPRHCQKLRVHVFCKKNRHAMLSRTSNSDARDKFFATCTVPCASTGVYTSTKASIVLSYTVSFSTNTVRRLDLVERSEIFTDSHFFFVCGFPRVLHAFLETISLKITLFLTSSLLTSLYAYKRLIHSQNDAETIF